MSTRVRRVAVDGWVRPEHVRRNLLGEVDHQVWLDAGPGAIAGRSFLGAGRTRLVTASVARGTVTERILANGLERELECTMVEFLRADLESHEDLSDAAPYSGDGDDRATNDGTFRLGWVGWFGYELGNQTVGAPVAASDQGIADACLVFLDRAVEFDHAAETIWALSFESDEAWAAEVARAVEMAQVHEIAVTAYTSDGTTALASVPALKGIRRRFGRQTYEALIARCLDEIRAGNAYQLCLTNRIDVEFETPPNPFELYELLRAESPTHHGGLIVSNGVSLLSSSPEVFLRVTPDGHVTTKPIKGTRPRGVDEFDDASLVEELRTNDKERAENLMIVDLMRNDVGRIARVGTVTVEKLLDVETYASVHQLVSTVGGDLAECMSVMDALEACFPAGSMTGAPKLSAMRILNGLEAGPRGIYSGAFGYLSLDGACDLAMVIRSIVLHGSHAYIGTGGGITSGSVASEEWEETLVKARPLLRVLGVSDDDAAFSGE